MKAEIDEISKLLQGWKGELDEELGVGRYSICLKNTGKVFLKKDGATENLEVLSQFLKNNKIPLDSFREQCQIIAESRLGAVLDEKIVQAKPKTTIIQSRLADLTLEDGLAELVDNGLRAAHQYYQQKKSSEKSSSSEIPTVGISFRMKKKEPHSVMISDNGTGMTTEILDDYAAMGFSTYKRPSLEERANDNNYTLYSRPGFQHFVKPSIGRHGKGKISCFQLGKEVEVVSTQEGSMLEHVLIMDHSRLINTEFEVIRRVGGLKEEHIGHHYTKIVVTKLNQDLKDCFVNEKKLKKLITSLCEAYFFHIEGFPDILHGRSQVKHTQQVGCRLIFKDLPICIDSQQVGNTLVIEKDQSRTAFHWRNTFAGQLLLQYQICQGDPFERYLRLTYDEPGQEYGEKPDHIITKVLLMDFYFHTDDIGQPQRPQFNEEGSDNLHSNGSPYCLCYWNGRYMKEAKFPREFPKFLLGPRTNKVGEASVHAFNRHAVFMFFDEYTLPNDKKNKLAENQEMEKALFDEYSKIEYFSPSRSKWLPVWKTPLQTEFRHFITAMNSKFDKEAHVKINGRHTQARQSEEGGLELVANEVRLDHLQHDLKPFNLVRVSGSADMVFGWAVEILQVIDTQEIRIKCLPVVSHRPCDSYVRQHIDGKIYFEMEEMSQIIQILSPPQIEHIYSVSEEEKALRALRKNFPSCIMLKNFCAEKTYAADDLPAELTVMFANTQKSIIPEIQRRFCRGIGLTLSKVSESRDQSDNYQESISAPTYDLEYTFEGAKKWHEFIQKNGCGEYEFRFIPTRVKYFQKNCLQHAECRFKIQVTPGVPQSWEVKWKGVGSTIPKVSIDSILPTLEIVVKNRVGQIIPPKEYPSSVTVELARSPEVMMDLSHNQELSNRKWVVMQQPSDCRTNGEFRLPEDIFSDVVLSDINGEEICVKVSMGDYLNSNLNVLLVAGKPAKLIIDEIDQYPKAFTFFQLLPDFTVRALDKAGNVCSAGVVRNKVIKFKQSVGIKLLQERTRNKTVPKLNGDGAFTFSHWFRVDEIRTRQGLLIQLDQYKDVQAVQLKFDVFPPILRIRNLHKIHEFETGVAEPPIMFCQEEFLAAYNDLGKGQEMTLDQIKSYGVIPRVYTVSGGQEQVKYFLPDGTSFLNIKQLVRHLRQHRPKSKTVAITLTEQDKLQNIFIEAAYPLEVGLSQAPIEDYKNEIQMYILNNNEQGVTYGDQIPFMSRSKGYKLLDLDLKKDLPIHSPYKEPLCVSVNEAHNHDIFVEFYVWKSRRISSCIKIINDVFVKVPVKISWNDKWYEGTMHRCMDAYNSSWQVMYEGEQAPHTHQLYSTEYTFQDLIQTQCGQIHVLEFEAWDQYQVRVDLTKEFIQNCNLECQWADSREGVEMETVEPLHLHPQKPGVGQASIRFLRPGQFSSRKQQDYELDVQVLLVHPSMDCSNCDWHFEVFAGPPAEDGLQIVEYGGQHPVQLSCIERQSLLLPFKLVDEFDNLIEQEGEVKLEHVSGSLCDYEDSCEVVGGKGNFLLQFCEYSKLVSDENMRIEPLVGMFKIFSPTWSHVNPVSVEISLKPSTFVKQLVYVNGDIFTNTEDSCCGSLPVDEFGIPKSWTARQHEGLIRVELGLLTYDGEFMNRNASLQWEVRSDDVCSKKSTKFINIATPDTTSGWMPMLKKRIEGKKLITSKVHVPSENKELELQIVQLDLTLDDLQPGSYNFRICYDDSHDVVYFPHNREMGAELLVKAGYPVKLMLSSPLDVLKTLQSTQAVESFKNNQVKLYCADQAGNYTTEGFSKKATMLVNYYLLKVDASGNLMDFDHVKIAKVFKPGVSELIISPQELEECLNFRGCGFYRLALEVVENNCSLKTIILNKKNKTRLQIFQKNINYFSSDLRLKAYKTSSQQHQKNAKISQSKSQIKTPINTIVQPFYKNFSFKKDINIEVDSKIYQYILPIYQYIYACITNLLSFHQFIQKRKKILLSKLFKKTQNIKKNEKTLIKVSKYSVIQRKVKNWVFKGNINMTKVVRKLCGSKVLENL